MHMTSSLPRQHARNTCARTAYATLVKMRRFVTMLARTHSYVHTRTYTLACTHSHVHARTYTLAHTHSQKWFALHPKFFPEFDLTEMMTQDAMHLEDDGNLGCVCLCLHMCILHPIVSHLVSHLVSDHGYWTFHTLIVKEKKFTLHEINKILQAQPRSYWEDGRPPPGLRKDVLKGSKGGLAKKAGRLRYTASNMRKFALAR